MLIIYDNDFKPSLRRAIDCGKCDTGSKKAYRLMMSSDSDELTVRSTARLILPEELPQTDFAKLKLPTAAVLKSKSPVKTKTGAVMYGHCVYVLLEPVTDGEHSIEIIANGEKLTLLYDSAELVDGKWQAIMPLISEAGLRDMLSDDALTVITAVYGIDAEAALRRLVSVRKQNIAGAHEALRAVIDAFGWDMADVYWLWRNNYLEKSTGLHRAFARLVKSVVAGGRETAVPFESFAKNYARLAYCMVTAQTWRLMEKDGLAHRYIYDGALPVQSFAFGDNGEKLASLEYATIGWDSEKSRSPEGTDSEPDLAWSDDMAGMYFTADGQEPSVTSRPSQEPFVVANDPAAGTYEEPCDDTTAGFENIEHRKDGSTGTGANIYEVRPEKGGAGWLMIGEDIPVAKHIKEHDAWLRWRYNELGMKMFCLRKVIDCAGLPVTARCEQAAPERIAIAIPVKQIPVAKKTCEHTVIAKPSFEAPEIASTEEAFGTAVVQPGGGTGPALSGDGTAENPYVLPMAPVKISAYTQSADNDMFELVADFNRQSDYVSEERDAEKDTWMEKKCWRAVLDLTELLYTGIPNKLAAGSPTWAGDVAVALTRVDDNAARLAKFSLSGSENTEGEHKRVCICLKKPGTYLLSVTLEGVSTPIIRAYCAFSQRKVKARELFVSREASGLGAVRVAATNSYKGPLNIPELAFYTEIYGVKGSEKPEMRQGKGYFAILTPTNIVVRYNTKGDADGGARARFYSEAGIANISRYYTGCAITNDFTHTYVGTGTGQIKMWCYGPSVDGESICYDTTNGEQYKDELAWYSERHLETPYAKDAGRLSEYVPA